MHPVIFTRTERRIRLGVAALASGAVLAGSVGVVAAPVASDVGDRVSVVVREAQPLTDVAERAVSALGGVVETQLPIVGGFAAEVPAAGVDALTRTPGVTEVAPAAAVSFDGSYGQGTGGPSAVYSDVVRAPEVWAEGYRGQGVGVAVIDTGVNPVGDLAGRVVKSVDFTAEADGVDRYGHGTFVAGMIAGTGATGAGVRGVAPEANIISLKIAGRDGSADITHVLAALQWAVSFKDVYGIRIVNLSLGTDSTQDYRLALLNYAVERAWANGLVVVVSGSNRGPDKGTISKPADDPFVITVGAADDRSTKPIADDTVPAFSAAGPTKANGIGKPDLVAPGKSVVSTRAPGSTVDANNPSARIGTHHFVGSGTSFATGVTAGAAALVLSRDPSLNPDQVKQRLLSTARSGPVTDVDRAGRGWLDAFAATTSDDRSEANQGLYWSEGTGSVQASRGSLEVQIETGTILDPLLGPLPILTLLTGDLTAQNEFFDYSEYRDVEWTGTRWYDSQWSGTRWYGTRWYGTRWYGTRWYGADWE